MISKWQGTHFSCGSRCIFKIQTDKNRKNLKEKVDIEMKPFQMIQLNILIDLKVLNNLVSWVALFLATQHGKDLGIVAQKYLQGYFLPDSIH